MNIFLCPAIQDNINKTILNEVSITLATKFLEPTITQSLQNALAGNNRFKCWAMTENLRSTFESMTVGDLVFLSVKNSGSFKFVAKVLYKFESESLGKVLWSFVGDNPWKYIYVLDNLTEINISKEKLITSLGYKQNDRVQKARRVSEIHLNIAISKFGSIDNFLKHIGVNFNSHPETDIEYYLRQGAMFGVPELNKEVEKAAVRFVTEEYEKDGWKVKSVESEKCGYDLICSKDKVEEHVEVKGIRGTEISFIITANEVKQAKSNSKFVICAVTSALSNERINNRFTGQEFIGKFSLKEIAYNAVL